MTLAHPRISIDPARMVGKPVIAGTRMPVDLILRELGHGRTVADVVEAYPAVSADDVLAALRFAADLMTWRPAEADTARDRGSRVKPDDLFEDESSVAAQ